MERKLGAATQALEKLHIAIARAEKAEAERDAAEAPECSGLHCAQGGECPKCDAPDDAPAEEKKK